jgi:hypothetical protein
MWPFSKKDKAPPNPTYDPKPILPWRYAGPENAPAPPPYSSVASTSSPSSSSAAATATDGAADPVRTANDQRQLQEQAKKKAVDDAKQANGVVFNSIVQNSY